MAGSISALIPEFQPWAHALVDAAGAAGLQPRVTSTLRTRAEQTRLYRRFMAGQSQFPAAPPGRSAHEYGYALDLVVSPFDAIYDVADWWLSQGGIWHEADVIHFEYPGFTVPHDRGTNLLGAPGEAIRTVAEWFAGLPWYVQILLPTWTSTSDEPITKEKIKQLLG